MENQPVTGVRTISPIINNLKTQYDQKALATAVGFLIKLLTNIENNPLDVKYRKIKTTNKTLKSKVFAFKGIEKILESIGFNLQQEFYVFSAQDVTSVRQALIILRAREVELNAMRTGEITAAQRELMAEIEATKRRQEEEKKRIMSGVENDRNDYQDHMKDKVFKDSVGNSLTFGANVMLAKDCLPLAQGGGG